jgi:hypothetical protein
MKHIKTGLFVGTAMAALMAASVAQAQNVRSQNNANAPVISYTHVGARYMFQDLDINGGSCDQDGINVYGSMDVKEGWFAKASFADVSGDGCGSTSVSVGGGIHSRLDRNLDAYATLSFESISPNHGSSDSGLILAAGLRGFLGQQLEGGVELYHSTTFDGQTAIHGSLLYWFNDALAVTGDLGLGSDVTTFAIGARLNF